MEAGVTAHVDVWNRYASHFNTINRLLVHAFILNSSSLNCLSMKRG